MEKNHSQLKRHALAEELFGSLEKHEFEGLKHGLQENSQGARVWLYQGRILCGWHTYLACGELGIEPEYVQVEVSNDGEALLKALSVELRRRSFTEQQRCAIWFRAAVKIPPLREAMDRIVKDASVRKRSGLNQGKKAPCREPQVEANGKAAAKIGQLLGVSRAVVERDRKLFNLSPVRHARVAAGADYDSQIRHANTDARIKRAEALPPVDLKDIRLLHCDFRDLGKRAEIEPESAGLVILDPPYYAEFVKDYGEVAELAARWLDPEHGMLIALVGGLWLPDVLDMIRPFLKYHWSASIYYGQRWGVKRGRVMNRVRECHRPVLVFRAKENTKLIRNFNDVIECKEAEKEWHPMQQPIKVVKHYIEAFTEPHDLVIDTHGGAFTTAAACLLTKRRYIGCDVDSQAVQNGELRVREVAHELGLTE